MSSYRVHFETGRLDVHRQPIFACGRAQQICPLRASADWAEVTCLACLKERP